MAYYNSQNGSASGSLHHSRMLSINSSSNNNANISNNNGNNNNSSTNTSSSNNSGSNNRSSSSSGNNTSNSSATSNLSFNQNRQNLHLSNGSPLSLTYPRSNNQGPIHPSSSFHHHPGHDFREPFVNPGLEAASLGHHSHHPHTNPELYLPLHQAFSHLQGCRGLPDLPPPPPPSSCLSNQEAAVLSVANFRDYLSGGSAHHLNPHDVYHNPSPMDYCNGLGGPVHCNSTPVYPWMTVVGESTQVNL